MGCDALAHRNARGENTAAELWLGAFGGGSHPLLPVARDIDGLGNCTQELEPSNS